VGVLSFESVLGWPVGSSSLGASGGQGLGAHWLAVFLLSVSAGHWEAGSVFHSHECKCSCSWYHWCLSGWSQGLWLNTVVAVKPIADLDWGSSISFSHSGVNSGKWLDWKGVVGFACSCLVGVSSSAEWCVFSKVLGSWCSAVWCVSSVTQWLWSVLKLSKVVMGVW